MRRFLGGRARGENHPDPHRHRTSQWTAKGDSPVPAPSGPRAIPARLVQARRTGPSDAEPEAAAQGAPFAILAQSWAFDWSLVAAVRHLPKEEAAAHVPTHRYKTHLLGFLLKRSAGLPCSLGIGDSDVIVIPSTAFEAVPNVLLEAMAAGRPVVATNVGGISEVVVNEEDGLLVAPSDAGALAAAIGRLLGDKLRRDRLVAGGRRRIRASHSPTRRAEHIGQVYAGILAG